MPPNPAGLPCFFPVLLPSPWNLQKSLRPPFRAGKCFLSG